MEYASYSVSSPHTSPSDIKKSWLDALQGLFPADLVEEYATSLSKQYVTLSTASTLTDAQLAEMKVRVGHRRDLLVAAANVAPCDGLLLPTDSMKAASHTASMDHDDIEKIVLSEPMPPTQKALSKKSSAVSVLAGPFKWLTGSSDVEVMASIDAAEMPGAADGTTSPPRPRGRGRSTIALAAALQAAYVELHSDDYCNAKNVTWTAMHGSSPSLESFLATVGEKRRTCGFPDSFDRALLDNRPMPFQVIQGSSVLILLRVPDLGAVDGSTVSEITNRFVIMFSLKRRRLLTYHRCQYDFLSRVTTEWSNDWSVVDVVDRILRRFADTYVHGVDMLQGILDDCENMSNSIAIVERLTGVQKRAQVFSRCLKAGVSELVEVGNIPGLHERINAHVDQFESVRSMLEEITDNSRSTMDMHMALDGFRSGNNMRVFTLLSVFCQPITVATGWYGMNWVNFPELPLESGYYVFSGVVVGFAFLFTLFFILKTLQAG